MGDVNSIKEVQEVQGRNGTWNSDNYMCGLYNGLELASAILEDREPNYRNIKEDNLMGESMSAQVQITDPHELAKQTKKSLIQAKIDLNKGKITDGSYRHTLHFAILNLADAIEKITKPTEKEKISDDNPSD